MQTGKRLGVVFAPRNHISPPGLLVVIVYSMEGGSVVFEPVGGDAEPVPLLEFRPGLRFELCFRVGGNDDAGILESGHAPEDEPTEESRLADIMTGGNCNLDCFVDRQETVTNRGEDFRLPCVRPCLVGEVAASPRK